MTSGMLPFARAVRFAVPELLGVGRRLLLVALLLPLIPQAAVAEVVYSYTGALQTFTAPATGNYRVVANGAAGTNGQFAGGLGATASGDLFLTAGDILSVIVGGKGTASSPYGYGAGGGGGTFIFTGSVPLLVAGGGGGGAYASAGQNSTGLGGSGLGGAGGVSNGFGAGGAGFFGDGGTGAQAGGGSSYGGKDAANGFLGGIGYYGGNGGFGGGGSAGFASGGGGGGYTGGNGGAETGPGQAFGGGAGTSYYDSNLVTSFSLTGGAVSGNGSLTIAAVPEIDPAGMASVLALVTGALGLLERRRTSRLVKA